MSEYDSAAEYYVAEIKRLQKEVAELKQQLAQHEWVSVDDSLPEDYLGLRFLVRVSIDNEFFEYKVTDFNGVDFRLWLSDSARVTHWKPISPQNNSGE